VQFRPQRFNVSPGIMWNKFNIVADPSYATQTDYKSEQNVEFCYLILNRGWRIIAISKEFLQFAGIKLR
jgi:hypothetical protein